MTEDTGTAQQWCGKWSQADVNSEHESTTYNAEEPAHLLALIACRYSTFDARRNFRPEISWLGSVRSRLQRMAGHS
jgi:hypothetical protein